MLGHFFASSSYSARVMRRQELPPKPSTSATRIGFAPHTLSMATSSSTLPIRPTVAIILSCAHAPPVAAKTSAKAADASSDRRRGPCPAPPRSLERSLAILSIIERSLPFLSLVPKRRAEHLSPRGAQPFRRLQPDRDQRGRKP